MEMPDEGRNRVVIVAVAPVVDSGRYPAKAEVGLPVRVGAQVIVDGHDQIRAWCRWDGPEGTRQIRLVPGGDDWWYGTVTPGTTGLHHLAIEAEVDQFQSWRTGVQALQAAGTLTATDIAVGATLLEEALPSLAAGSRKLLRPWLERLSDPDLAAAATSALHPDLESLIDRVVPARYPTVSQSYPVQVEPLAARFSTWYECFPRSTSPDRPRPGTFADLRDRLSYIAGMGFDVLYLPPIHPIGTAFRKGPNNTLVARPGDPGSPWAIGSREGGHMAVHPELGTLADFRALVHDAGRQGLHVAMDLAFQCSPDHPWVTEHPEWFKTRPDGTIQYAQNPPKRYQDIYPFDFESEEWRGLWQALLEVVRFWVNEGVSWFRVDNPHTKPIRFWEWLLACVREQNPEVVFLAEAFTRPAVMYQLAKVGFTQSYTYFTWRNQSQELRQYLEELTRPPVANYFRSNFFVNTPDILPLPLQSGDRGVFLERLILAGTLSPSYGIYGPAFELREHDPLTLGGEEYRNSEKYQIRHWDWERHDSLSPEIARLNQIRREHPALWWSGSLVFHAADSKELLVYSKRSPDSRDTVLIVVSLDPLYPVAGFVHLDLGALGLAPESRYLVRDLMTGEVYVWTGADNYVELRPGRVPAHIFQVTSPVPNERDFDALR